MSQPPNLITPLKQVYIYIFPNDLQSGIKKTYSSIEENRLKNNAWP